MPSQNMIKIQCSHIPKEGGIVIVSSLQYALLQSSCYPYSHFVASPTAVSRPICAM